MFQPRAEGEVPRGLCRLVVIYSSHAALFANLLCLAAEVCAQALRLEVGFEQVLAACDSTAFRSTGLRGVLGIKTPNSEPFSCHRVPAYC